VDVVTFTSPSTVRNFVKLAKEAKLDPFAFPLFACIGPVTEKAARELGFSPLIVAETYTTDGLVEILKKSSS
jgi:uroporphyrinogen-III synthase